MCMVEAMEHPDLGEACVCMVHGPLVNKRNGGFGLVVRPLQSGGCAIGVMVYGFEQSSSCWPMECLCGAWGDWGASILPGLWLKPSTAADSCFSDPAADLSGNRRGRGSG